MLRNKSTKPRRPRRDLEHKEQSMLFQWADLKSRYEMPDLWLLHAIPNGSNKSLPAAMKFKREGLKSGVPDVCLPVPRGRYHGLYIEMKSPGASGSDGGRYAKRGTVSDEQTEWLSRLSQQGYQCYVCWTFDEAKSVIESYLNLKPLTHG